MEDASEIVDKQLDEAPVLAEDAGTERRLGNIESALTAIASKIDANENATNERLWTELTQIRTDLYSLQSRFAEPEVATEAEPNDEPTVVIAPTPEVEPEPVKRKRHGLF